MKRFRFSLQALFTVRQRQEQQTLEVYARALAAQQQAADRLCKTERECEQVWQLSRQRRASAAPAAHLAQMEDYCHVMEEFRKRCAEALRQARQATSAALKKFLAARQAREAVDKFRTRQRERHDHEARREEQKMIDEGAQRGTIATAGRLSVSQRWN